MPIPATDTSHLLLPFASAPGAACAMALRKLDLPHLQALLARLSPVLKSPYVYENELYLDESSLSPPHERALARALGLNVYDGLLPWAALKARDQKLPNADGEGWGLLSLCHWQVGMSEVVMDDPQHMDITPHESEALLAIARPFFEDDGLHLFPGTRSGQWLVRGALLQDLPTASVDRAVGQPLAPWLPMGDAARPLRRLQNEMQMLLYTHPVNDERAAQRRAPINSFWLSGTGREPTRALAASPKVAEHLRNSALQDDGAGWARCWEQVDEELLAPLRAQVDAGQRLTLTLCGARDTRIFENRPRGLGGWLRSRFRKPDVAAVLEAL